MTLALASGDGLYTSLYINCSYPLVSRTRYQIRLDETHKFNFFTLSITNIKPVTPVMSLVMRVLRTLQVLPTLTVLLSLSAYAPAAASPQLSAEVPTEGGLRISNVITRFEPKDNPIFRMVYVVVDEYEGQSAYADGGEGGGVQAERQSVCYFDSVGHRGVWVGGEVSLLFLLLFLVGG